MKSVSVFLAVFLAIALSVLIFAPERLPPGIGVTATPIEASQRPSFFGQGQVAVFRNPTPKTLHNVKIVLLDSAGNVVKGGQREVWAPGTSMELGWLEGWHISEGTTIRISASGHYPQNWQY